VLGPPTIDRCPLFVGEREFSLALTDGKALPKSHRKFSSIAGRKFQELGKRAGFHAVILSHGVSCRNRPVRSLGTRVATEPWHGPAGLPAWFGCWFSGLTLRISRGAQPASRRRLHAELG